MTTETTGQHTPTPWDLQTLRVSLVPVMIRVNGYIKETAEANAAFIVRACNNHDNLVEALRKISVHSSYTPSDAGNISFAYDSVRKIARTTLIAATKE